VLFPTGDGVQSHSHQLDRLARAEQPQLAHLDWLRADGHQSSIRLFLPKEAGGQESLCLRLRLGHPQTVQDLRAWVGAWSPAQVETLSFFLPLLRVGPVRVL
jgi:hypothetical protein